MGNCFSSLEALEREVKRLSKFQETEDVILSIVRTYYSVHRVSGRRSGKPMAMNSSVANSGPTHWIFSFFRNYLLNLIFENGLESLEKYPYLINFCFKKVFTNKITFEQFKPDEIAVLASIAGKIEDG